MCGHEHAFERPRPARQPCAFRCLPSRARTPKTKGLINCALSGAYAMRWSSLAKANGPPEAAKDELACRAEFLEMLAMRDRRCLLWPLAIIWAGCAIAVQTLMGANYPMLIRNGTIYDGSGRAPFVGDVAIEG